MAGICTGSVSPGNCSHRQLTINLDGESIVVQMHEGEADDPLTADDKELLLKLALRRLRTVKGVTLAQLLNRVVNGDEATNVRQYDFLAPGSVVTKTNIGTAYVNVNPGANGERVLADFTGCTEFRVILTANLVSTGAFGARIIRDSDSTVLFENASIALTGERELDTGWVSVPVGFTAETLLRLQMKSATAADDPIVRRCALFTR